MAGKIRLSAELAVEGQLHVAGALELLVDDVVHAAAGVDQAGGDDRQAAAALDVARGAEEALRRVERDRVHTTGERLARRRHRQVVGAGQAGDRVEQDDDVAAGLDQALRALEAISATRVWSSTGSSKVEEKTSPSTERCMSVTSSGRSPMSATMRCTSG